MKTKVLIIDDSAIIRKVFTEELSKDKDIEVIGTASNPYIARDKIIMLKPDVITLDIEMPLMDGITFLEKLMKHFPMPVIIVSSLTKNNAELALRAMELGAVDVLSKPGEAYSVGDMAEQLREKVKAAGKIKKVHKLEMKPSGTTNKINVASLNATNKVIAIGASTGGTEALKEVLTALPAEMPPILITQHMPANFTKSFSERLNAICKMQVKEAENGEQATPGKVLIAPGNKHMTLKRSGALYYVEVKDGPLVFHQRPSVEIMFNSVAVEAGRNAVGVILTGMGRDGAGGLLEMRKAGAYTIAQDEKSCVVFGMPKEAIEVGGVMKILPLTDIPRELKKYSI